MDDLITKFIDKVPRKMTAVLVGMAIMYKTAACPEIPEGWSKIGVLAGQAIILVVGVALHYVVETNGSGKTGTTP